MATSNQGLLKAETAYYDQHTKELLLTYPNRFVLMHGDQLIGDYETRSEAVAEGVRRHGQSPFLLARSGSLEGTIPARAGWLSKMKQQATYSRR